MSSLSKLKLMKLTSVEREYREKYPALNKIASSLDNTILVDELSIRKQVDRINTADQLDFSKIQFNDISFITTDFVPPECLSEELEKLAGIQLYIVVRLVRMDEHRFRVFYYLRQSDNRSYVMVYSAILDDQRAGMVGEIDMNQKIVLRDRGFHPGVISISTFENLINLIKNIEEFGLEAYYTPPDSFAFKKNVPLSLRATHKHYRVAKID